MNEPVETTGIGPSLIGLSKKHTWKAAIFSENEQIRDKIKKDVKLLIGCFDLQKTFSMFVKEIRNDHYLGYPFFRPYSNFLRLILSKFHD